MMVVVVVVIVMMTMSGEGDVEGKFRSITEF
jgi:hypothetical protein